MRIGLTGGIAAGKSMVSGLLAELGAWILDADAISREVVAPDPFPHTAPPTGEAVNAGSSFAPEHC